MNQAAIWESLAFGVFVGANKPFQISNWTL